MDSVTLVLALVLAVSDDEDVRLAVKLGDADVDGVTLHVGENEPVVEKVTLTLAVMLVVGLMVMDVDGV